MYCIIGGPIFSHFHAVLRKNWSNYRLLSLWSCRPAPVWEFLDLPLVIPFYLNLSDIFYLFMGFITSHLIGFVLIYCFPSDVELDQYMYFTKTKAMMWLLGANMRPMHFLHYCFWFTYAAVKDIDRVCRTDKCKMHFYVIIMFSE